MLAQLNSKQKSIFFNIKPTVIDKLISKNKSSIQNTLLYTNEDSDGSLSEDSEESSSSSQENNLVLSLQHSITMAPVRRSEKVVLGSKLASMSQFPLKRGRGRPPKNQIGRNGSNFKVMSAKTVVENSKKSSPRKITRGVQSIAKLKRNPNDSTAIENVKRLRTPIKKENVSATENISNNSNESLKTTITKGRPKMLKNIKQELVQNKGSRKIPLCSQNNTTALINIKSSPRKFPSNIVDRWKSTGMVIRGRGKSRGTCRGGVRRGALRSERYNTRDSQTGLMRSGKRRNCCDSNFIEGLDGLRKKRKVITRIKKENDDCSSDQNSSFLTTSELSFYDNENSFKQTDDEIVNSGLIKVKIEIDESEDESIESRDTNSNVFKNNLIKSMKNASVGSDTNGQSNNPQAFQNTANLGPKEMDCKRHYLSEKKLVTQSDSSVKDSDCSLDSDLTEYHSNSSKSIIKRHKRKTVGGLWVRRSTRSIGKNIDKAVPDAVVIEELLKEKDLLVNSDSTSKSSFNNDDVTSHDLPVKLADSEIISLEENLSSNAEIETDTTVKVDINNFRCLGTCVDSNEKKSISAIDLVEPDIQSNFNSEVDHVNDDSLIDFTLALEESPVKSSVGPSSETVLGTPSHKETIKVSSFKTKIDISEIISVTESKLEESNVEKINEPNNIDFESKSCTVLSECGSNNRNVLANSVQAIATTDSSNIDGNVNDLENNAEERNVSINTKDEAMDVMFDEIDVKLKKQGYNDGDVISDEKILSLIDSFCQSDSTNTTVDEKNQEPLTVINKPDEDKMIIHSPNVITFGVEENTAEGKCLEGLSNSSEFLDLNDSSMSNSEQITQSIIEDGKEDMKCKLSPINRISCEKELTAGMSENVEKTSGSIDDNVKNSVFSNGSENNEIDNNFENNMEIDLDNPDKVPESTEESSTSDSNSNLSELMSVPLEPDTARLTMTDIDNLGKTEGETNILPDEVVKECSEASVKDAEIHSPTQCSNLSSSVNLDPTNQMEPVKQISCNQSKLLKSSIEVSTEERPSKELLSALGLQSLHSAVEEKPKRPNDNYTGTLKAVIKLNRSSDKKSGGRKMIFKQGDKLSETPGGSGDRLEYRICSTEGLSTEGVPLTHLADIPAHRKAQIKVKSQFDLSNSPNIVGAAGSMETPSDSTKDAGGKQNLVIPEKSSSFSIHPERLCTDVCSYCFGKFGSLDTPCHLAQLKNSERQAKILAIEVHLSADSCLCDGCFRYVDRKANCPTSQRSRKPAARRGPLAGTICAVQDCTQPARHSVRRKWLIKLKKSIGKKLVIDMDKNPHLPFPLCSQHYYWVDYFTVCGICKKRLTRNHMYALGPEADELNQALSDDGIPVRLSDKLFLCKLCRYYSSLRLKYRDPTAMSSTHRLFLNSYRKKILHYHDIPVSDSEDEGKSVEEEATTSEVPKAKKKKSKSKSLDGHESKKRSGDKEEKPDTGNGDRSNDSQMIDYSYLDSLNVHREEPTTPTVDYSSLGDFEGGFSNIASFLNPLEGGQGTVYPSDSQNRSRTEKPTRIQVKFGNLNIGKLSNLNIGQDTRPASSATPALERPPYLPGERDLNLSGEFEFHGTLNPTSSWERCTSTIQFDRDTKKMWQELQRPYGNQSSFLRHLVILEKHWRNGSLVLSDSPNPRAVKYINSVRNRVQAYDGAKSSDAMEDKIQPELNLTSPPPRPMSTPIKITSNPPPLMKITPGSTPWLQNQLKRPPPYKFPTTSTQTTSTNNRVVPTVTAQAPPPYRFPGRQSLSGPRTLRMPIPSPNYMQTGGGQQNVRPLSISYQQFKKIRLEQPQPVVSTSQITVTPKIESTVELQPTSTSTTSEPDFVPLICDVRSLATSTSDWNESFRKQQQKLLKQNVAKYYTPILPKIPRSLTVTTFPQTSALVMKTSSLTIEKAPNVNTKPHIAPPEKPSISVFRETTPSENG